MGFQPFKFNVSSVESISCASHTIQIAVNNSLKLFKEELHLLHDIVVLLRKPKIRKIIEEKKFKIPPRDIPTRWNSTYYLIKSIKELEDLINDSDFQVISGVKIESHLWDFINEFCLLYGHLEVLTKKTQTSDYIYTDFLVDYFSTFSKLDISENSIMKTNLITSLEEKENLIWNHNLGTTAMLIDPRLRDAVKDNTNYVRNAVEKLTGLSNKEKLLTRKEIDKETEKQELQNDSNYYLNKRFKKSSEVKHESADIVSDFMKWLDHQVVINGGETIINTWYSLKSTFPRLFPVVRMILIVPSSQADVECSFSALKLLLSDLRTNLSSDIVNKILFLKLNGYDDDFIEDIYDEYFEESDN